MSTSPNYEKILQAGKLITEAIRLIDSTTGWTQEQLNDTKMCDAHNSAAETLERAQGRVTNLMYHVRRVEG